MFTVLLVVVVAVGTLSPSSRFAPGSIAWERSHSDRRSAPGRLRHPERLPALDRLRLPGSGWNRSMTRAYEGPQTGIGRRLLVVGQQEGGRGRMTIIQSRPDEGVVINLEFVRPF